MSRNWQNVVDEVMAKAAIYNTMIDMAQEPGCLHETAPAGSGERAGMRLGRERKTRGLADPYPEARNCRTRPGAQSAFI